MRSLHRQKSEQGTALARLLFGDANFTGRLPMTFPKSLADIPAGTPAQYPGITPAGTPCGPGRRPAISR